ncbi:hypothetical protein DID73_01790 [Candidatus Marinamargulisbacteria bacterium SCGC AG-343-K17]|nr:hypothetical protein DID73_01790 [Candidatus Marinamargulisbacteria bacterium SCGC AG-343-K17]
MILFVSGATGGHIYPGIAMAHALDEPSYFIVPRDHPAKKILLPYAYSYQVIGFSIKNILMFPILFFQILGVFIKKKPKAVMAMGGGICIPFAILAWILRVPVISFEQNAVPGRATRAIQFFSKKIITAFDSAKKGLILRSRVACLGNPIRLNYPDVDQLPNEWSDIQGKTLLVVGGSQGARAINEFIHGNREKIMALGVNIIHLTGDAFMKEAQIIERKADQIYMALPYINDMTIAYQKASIVLCRSGATTLAELHYQKLPSILIPYPYAMDDHQEKNAIEFSLSHHNATFINESELGMPIVKEKIVESSVIRDGVDNDSARKDTNTICELVKSYLE